MQPLYSVTLLLFMFFSTPSNATNNPLEKLHTLFTSPETRHQLNALRSTKSSSTPSVRTTYKPTHYIFQGIVIRNNKAPVIFLNDKSSSVSKNLSLNNYVLKISVNNKTLYLKPGEKSQNFLLKHNNLAIQAKFDH